MRKTFKRGIDVLSVSLMIIVFFTYLGALIAAEEQEIPDEIILDSDVYETNRKGPVTFSHTDHAEDYELECIQCHHDYKDGKNIWKQGDPVKKCSACHDPLKSKGKTKKLSVAYHKNCKGCHKRLVIEQGSTDAPYKKCYDCHELKK
jgi:hypothetical protein